MLMREDSALMLHEYAPPLLEVVCCTPCWFVLAGLGFERIDGFISLSAGGCCSTGCSRTRSCTGHRTQLARARGRRTWRQTGGEGATTRRWRRVAHWREG